MKFLGLIESIKTQTLDSSLPSVVANDIIGASTTASLCSRPAYTPTFLTLFTPTIVRNRLTIETHLTWLEPNQTLTG